MLIEGDTGRVFHHRGYPASEAERLSAVQLNISQAPNLQEMIDNKQPVIIADTLTDPAWLKREANSWTRAYIGTPICARDRVLGFLNINSATPNFFTPDHAKALQAFADQVALAIHNAQLLTQAHQQTERLTLLLDTARAASSTLNLDTILRLVAEQVVRTIDVTSCTISRWDHQADVVVTWIDFSLQEVDFLEEPGTTYSLNDYPLTRQVLESAEPATVFANDPEADQAEVAILQKQGVHSLYMFPLAVTDRVIGLIELFDAKPERRLTADELALCQALFDQIAIFIVNANLLDETR